MAFTGALFLYTCSMFALIFVYRHVLFCVSPTLVFSIARAFGKSTRASMRRSRVASRRGGVEAAKPPSVEAQSRDGHDALAGRAMHNVLRY